MEEEEHMLPRPPFWLQNDETDHHHRRYLRRSYSLILTSTSLIILLLVTALAFILIIVPTLHSFTSHIFKPHAVKKSWDSLNLLLVLFAIVCGFLSKNNSTESQTETETRTENPTETETQTPRYYYQERRSSFSSNAPFNRLRSFNSYPDLRLESPWIAADERWRFYDDTHLHRYRQPTPEAEEEELGVETVATVTSVEVATSPPPQSQPPPSPPPLPSSPQASRKAARRNDKRTYQSEIIEKLQPPPSPPQQPPPPASPKVVRRNAKRTYESEMSAENLQLKPSTPPPPPPPPPPKLVHGNKKRGTATKEFLTSLRGKKKKQRNRSVENFDTILNSQPFQPPSSAPPPPPPLSVFPNLFFSNKGKHKKRLSNERERSYDLEDKVTITSNESPLIPIPAPPPPPPFMLPAWKFRVHGDYVRIDSIGSSSRSESPVLDEVVESPISEENASQFTSPFALNDGGGGLFCPSPDVDTKANTFIERFRAGLRMEKMNSIKEKQGIGRSNLGLSSPNPQANEETTPTS